MSFESTYPEHIRHLQQATEAALAQHAYEALVLCSGAAQSKNRFDDQSWPLCPTPAFSHWVPLFEADSYVIVRPGKKPALVAYGNVSGAQRTALASAAANFRGDTTITGFRGGDSGGIRAIAGRFTVTAKRPTLAVPSARFVVTDLVDNRKITIERSSPLELVPPGAPAKPPR